MKMILSLAKSLPEKLGGGAAGVVRKVLLAWLLAVTVEYLILPAPLRDLQELLGLAQMSGLRILVIAMAVTAVLLALSSLKCGALVERWAMVAVFGIMALAALAASFTWAFLVACLLILAILVVYGRLGWNGSAEPAVKAEKAHWGWVCLTTAVAVGAFAFVSAWTVGRVYCMHASTYDFGIFAQMFHNMKETGLPMTTLERDGWMSHFDVHVSPIYYLMLPFYMLVPTPATLQVLQAAVMASAAIPLWLIGKRHGLSGEQRMLLCALLMVYPAYCAGASYDIHENCFLTPLLLWLFYGIEKKSSLLTVVTAVLTLMVKEDAAVYVAVIALWLILKNLVKLRSADIWGLAAGIGLLAAALGWFAVVTSYLASKGDGVMTYRYENFFFDGSTSLITVVKAVLMNPLKAVFESVDAQKLKFIGQTMIPLLGLPLLTRRYERLILLIPYLLVNLMSDYQYQHDIFFQYSFGSIAFLMYLAAVNLSELKWDWLKTGALILAVILGTVCMAQEVYPTAQVAPEYAKTYKAYYQSVRDALDTIPDDASVAASAFYTAPLSQRETIYDVYYCSREHLLECDYVALSRKLYGNYRQYATPGKDDGFERLVKLLEDNGYELYHELDGVLVIYKKK